MANIPELAAGKVSIFAETSSVAPAIGKIFKGGDKVAAVAGKRWGKLMSKGFDENKPDMDKLADDVKLAEKKITEETRRATNARRMLKAKEEAAQASLNEKIEKYGKESAQAKRAAVQLMQAQNNVEKETLGAADALDKLNRKLVDAREAYKRGENAADSYAKGWRGLAAKLTARTTSAVATAGVVATAVARKQGNKSGNAFTSGFGEGVSRLSGARAIAEMGEGFGDFVGNLDKTAPKFALMSSAVLTLSGGAIGAVGNLLALGGSIASIAPAALALPGIIGAGTAAFGVFALAAIDVVEVLGDLGPAFQRLQDHVSGNFWAEAAQPIRELAYSLLPVMQARLGETATVMGLFTAEIARTAQAQLPLGQLDVMFGYLNDSINKLQPAIQPVIESIMTLGVVGASYLPNLSGFIVDLTTDFNNFIQKADTDGSLRKWIDNGIQGLKDLGSVIYFTGAIFANLTKAFQDAGFDTTLGTLAGGLERINTALTGPVGQDVMAHIFGGARDALDGVAVGLSSISDSFVTLAPTLERIMGIGGQFVGTFLTHLATVLENPVFQQGLELFFTGALRGIEALAPAMGPLGTMFGTLAETVGLFLANMGPVISQILSTLAPVFRDILIAIQPLIPVLADTLLAAFVALIPHITALSIIFAEKVVPILIDLCHWIIENASWLAPLIVAVVGLAIALAPLISGLITLLPAILAVAPALAGVISAAAPVIGIIALLVVSVIGMWNTWSRIWNFIKTKIAQVATWIVTEALPWIASKIAWLNEKWQMFKAIVTAVWNKVKEKIAEVYGWFVGKVAEFKAKITELQTKFQVFKNTVGNIWDSFKRKLIDGYVGIKTNVIDKLSSAVKNALPDAFQKAKDSISRIWNGIKNVVKDPLRIVLRDILQNGLINKVNGILDNVDKKKTIPRIPRVWPLPGFREGGYTGNKRKDEVAGVVHGRENVINAEASASIERKAPGFLSSLNKHGAGAMEHLVGHEEGAAAGGPGGPGGALWSSLQNAMYSSGVAHLAGSIPGVNMGAVARAWNNMSNMRIKLGRGANQITGRSGSALGNWGYAWTNGNFELSPAVPGAMRTPTAIHEVGHVLGLMHESSGRSIMHPMMQGPTWPSAFDRATMQRIYGGAGKGNPPEGGGGFLSDIGSWLSEKIDPLSNFVKGIGGMLSSKMPEGNLFSDLAKAAVTRITDKIGDLVQEKIKGFFGGDESGAGARGKLPLYDNGGYLPKGRSLVENKTGKVEPILTNEQWRIQEKNAEIVSSRSANEGQTIINVEREKGEDGYTLGNKIDSRMSFLATRN